MSGTHRAAQSQSQPAPRRPGTAEEPADTAVPQVPADIYGPTGTVPDWDPIEPVPMVTPVSQRAPLGSQSEGMAAIRAVWERAGESERRRPARPGRPQRRREPKRLAPALIGILVCACLLMFFAWAAAPALWISIGHSHTGTVTVTSCDTGFAPSCTGHFTTGEWHRDLALTGDVTAADLGAELPARATGPDAHNAYVGGTAGLLLRWAPALVLFMCAAFALVTVSGATRLYEGRSGAIGLCWTAAGIVLAATLAFAW